MKNKKGFTLIELLAVIAILAVLAVIATPLILKIFNNSKDNTMIIQENEIVSSAILFLEDYCDRPISSKYKSECKSLLLTPKYSKSKLNSTTTNDKYVCVSSLKDKNYFMVM